MKILSSVSNEKLHELTLTASQNEKSATLVLLDHLAEVDRRRLYAVMGYQSLWEYTHQALQYSEAQASERVNAMRLMVKVPEVKEELQSGKITLTSVVKLATHVNREKCDVDETVDLLQEISGLSTREAERVLARESTEEARPDQVRVVSESVTRITIDVNDEFLSIMKRVQELAGHPGSKAQELFKLAMVEFVKKREVRVAPAKSKASQPKNPAAEEPVLRAPEVGVPANPQQPRRQSPLNNSSRYVASSIKTTIRIRSGDQCEYIDPKTKRRCEARMNLEFDHIQPLAKGGPTTAENLRHYCANHNRFAAIQHFGRPKMREFFKF